MTPAWEEERGHNSTHHRLRPGTSQAPRIRGHRDSASRSGVWADRASEPSLKGLTFNHRKHNRRYVFRMTPVESKPRGASHTIAKLSRVLQWALGTVTGGHSENVSSSQGAESRGFCSTSPHPCTPAWPSVPPLKRSPSQKREENTSAPLGVRMGRKGFSWPCPHMWKGTELI